MKATQLTRKNFAKPAFVPARVQNPPQATDVDDIGYYNTSMLYDSFSVAPAAPFPTMTPMFQVPTSAGKTLAQTNMTGAGILNNQEQFNIKRIRAIISGNTYLTDAMNIAQLCSLKLYVKGREFISGPLMAFPGGGGVQMTAVGGTTAAGNLTTGVANGDNNYKNAFTFADDIPLKNGVQAQVNITAETAFSMTAAASGGMGTTVYVFLDGKRLRGVA